jgi:hypothetical protein
MLAGWEDATPEDLQTVGVRCDGRTTLTLQGTGADMTARLQEDDGTLTPGAIADDGRATAIIDLVTKRARPVCPGAGFLLRR